MNIEQKSDSLYCPDYGERRGLWSKHEHELMFNFMVDKKAEVMSHIDVTISSIQRFNKSQFFVDMAKYIRTKTDKQCKSRYQKKERVLLEALDIPNNILENYFRSRVAKFRVVKHIQKDVSQTKFTQPESLEIGEKYFSPINSYNELRRVITIEVLPKIKNPQLKLKMKAFMERLPCDKDPIADQSVSHTSTFNQEYLKRRITIKKDNGEGFAHFFK